MKLLKFDAYIEMDIVFVILYPKSKKWLKEVVLALFYSISNIEK